MPSFFLRLSKETAVGLSAVSALTTGIRHDLFGFLRRRVRRRTSVPGSWGARTLCQFWHRLLDAIPRSHRRQLERHYEGHVARKLRCFRRLYQKLLRLENHRPHLFRHLRPDGPVRLGQRRRRRPHETPRRIAQTGNEACPHPGRKKKNWPPLTPILFFPTHHSSTCQFLNEFNHLKLTIIE